VVEDVEVAEVDWDVVVEVELVTIAEVEALVVVEVELVDVVVELPESLERKLAVAAVLAVITTGKGLEV